MRPTVEKPLLVGILVDVSGSMMNSIKNVRGKTTTRLESFRDSLEELIQKAEELSLEGDQIAPLVKIFAYGFGFGNLLTQLFGSSVPPVRDLLDLPGTDSSTVAIDILAKNWIDYKHHIENMASQMMGNTPMGEGFRSVRDRFREEISHKSYTGQPVLFVLSDGEPTDSTDSEILQLAKQIRDDGIIIVSGYVTDEDITEPRHLYRKPSDHWPNGARLMFECATILPENSPFHTYLHEYMWSFEIEGRLFTQINQSEILSEFMQAILSPLVNTESIEEITQKTKGFLKDSERADLTQSLRDDLVNELSNLPLTSTPNGRTQLLDGIPGTDSISRDLNIRRLDLDLIITQLARLGPMANGELPLVKLIDNALPYASGFEVAVKLERIQKELQST